LANSKNSVKLRWLASLSTGCLAGAVFGLVFFLTIWITTVFADTSGTTSISNNVSLSINLFVSGALGFSLLGALIGPVIITPIVLILGSFMEKFNSKRPQLNWLPLPIILWVGGVGGAAAAMMIASVWLRSSSVLSATAAHIVISGTIAGVTAALSYAKNSPFVHSRWSTAFSKTQDETQGNAGSQP
jgi:hypothetical protein